MSESKGRLKVLAGGLGEAPAAGEGAAESEGFPTGLVVEHLGVADALARRYRVPGQDAEDLRQVARLGLVMAAQRYREGAGHGFVQFAVPTIVGTIKRHLRDQSWVVRPPRSLQELRLRVKEARSAVGQELGREPSLAELSEATGSSLGRVAEALNVDAAFAGTAIELLDGASELDGEGMAHVVSVIDPGFEEVEQRQLLAAALEGATAAELRLVRMRFVEQMSQSDIAAELGVSQMQVSRLLRRLLDRMRRNIAA